MEQSEHLYRVAKQDIEYDGIRIPRGWLVRLCVQESHRDPESFVDPDTFDPNRFRDHTYSRRRVSPFGVGRRACIGEAIARTVGRLFVEEVGRSWQVQTADQDGSTSSTAAGVTGGRVRSGACSVHRKDVSVSATNAPLE